MSWATMTVWDHTDRWVTQLHFWQGRNAILAAIHSQAARNLNCDQQLKLCFGYAQA